MFPFLTLVFGLGWTVTYIACIRLGFRDRTYCMPAVALALNFSWECVFTAHALQEALGLQTVVNIVWTVLDAVILVTFLRFGRTEQPRPTAGALRLLTSLRDGRDIEAQPVSRVTFATWAVVLLAVGFAVQILFVGEFGYSDAAVYSAFLINVFMSLAFLAMAATRPPGRGQSRVIAVSKLVGTLGATAAFGIVASSAFVLGLGIICAVLDVLYLIVVIRDIDRRTSTATAAEPASRASASQDLQSSGSGR
jgi:hypothetical protein